MKLQPNFEGTGKENIDLRTLPIPEAPDSIRKRFENAEWKKIPIREEINESPKQLEVIPNRFNPDGVMAWPAYYKTVMEEHEHDDHPKGFGELAEAIEGGIQTSPLVKVRNEVKERLDRAQRTLNTNPDTSHLQLVVVDGYRRIDVQGKLFNAYSQYVKKEHPELSGDALITEARKMVSEAPADPEILRKSPPPHSTGGAVDVVLVSKDKIDTTSDYWLHDAMVPFGARFDEMMNPDYRDERSETTFYEKKLADGAELNAADREALENRRMLYHAMKDVGFSNFFTEFWHYDFGNQFNALASEKSEAEFGFAGGIGDGTINEDLAAERASFEKYAAAQGKEEAERVKHHFGL